MIKKASLAVILATVFQVGTASAQSGVFEKDILDQSAPGRSLKVEFKVNTESPELGRAWLHAYYDVRSLQDNDGPAPKAEDIMVPGLSYDAASGQIVYKKADGSKVVCADHVTSGVVSGMTYDETRNCKIELSKTIINQDSGFYVKKSPGMKVTLQVQN